MKINNTEEKTRLSRKDGYTIFISAIATIIAGFGHYTNMSAPLTFIISTISLAGLASLVGRSVEALGDRFSPGAIGILQSGLGNLPEIFVTIFALKAGLIMVVQATIIGSMLSNILLILGAGFLVGGLKHGVQKFPINDARNMSLLLLLAVVALSIPSFTSLLHTPASHHERILSVVISIALLGLFALSLPDSLKRKALPKSNGEELDGALRSPNTEKAIIEAEGHPHWSLSFTIGMLLVTSILAAFDSDWFITALTPAMNSFHISQAFAGLIIVAIAGNAVENVVGVQLAMRNKSEYTLQVILQSPLQISLIVAPLLILVAPLVGASAFTLVFPPMLLVALLVSTIVVVVIVFDAESNWLEGAALLILYMIIATAFWWG